MEFSKSSLRLLKKAAKTLDEALKIKPQSQIAKDGVIQRFEYTYALAWKTLKRYFQTNQKLLDFNVEDIWRKAGKIGLVDKVEQWFEFHKARKDFSHAYECKTANLVDLSDFSMLSDDFKAIAFKHHVLRNPASAAARKAS